MVSLYSLEGSRSKNKASSPRLVGPWFGRSQSAWANGAQFQLPDAGHGADGKKHEGTGISNITVEEKKMDVLKA